MTTPDADDKPSGEVRDAILAQHETLRVILARTVELADLSAASAQEFDALRAQARTLYESLAAHMDFEERVLPTALRDVIGWGAMLQAQLEEDHSRQRASLATALDALGPNGLSGVALIESVRTFAQTLLVDMEGEESGLLEADLDAIATDTKGG